MSSHRSRQFSLVGRYKQLPYIPGQFTNWKQQRTLKHIQTSMCSSDQSVFIIYFPHKWISEKVVCAFICTNSLPISAGRTLARFQSNLKLLTEVRRCQIKFPGWIFFFFSVSSFLLSSKGWFDAGYWEVDVVANFNLVLWLEIAEPVLCEELRFTFVWRLFKIRSGLNLVATIAVS